MRDDEKKKKNVYTLTDGPDPQEEASMAGIVLGGLAFPQCAGRHTSLDVRGILK